MFLISWKKCWWWTVQIKHFPDHYHSLLSDVAFKCKHHSAFLALVSRTRIPLNSTWTFRNHCVWNIVDRKSKVISLYNLKMRSILIYLSYEFSDRNEGMDVTFKNDIFSHLNAFCENKLTLRDVFFAKSCSHTCWNWSRISSCWWRRTQIYSFYFSFMT